MAVRFCQSCRTAFAGEQAQCPRCGAALPKDEIAVPRPWDAATSAETERPPELKRESPSAAPVSMTPPVASPARDVDVIAGPGAVIRGEAEAEAEAAADSPTLVPGAPLSAVAGTIGGASPVAAAVAPTVPEPESIVGGPPAPRTVPMPVSASAPMSSEPAGARSRNPRSTIKGAGSAGPSKAFTDSLVAGPNDPTSLAQPLPQQNPNAMQMSGNRARPAPMPPSGQPNTGPSSHRGRQGGVAHIPFTPRWGRVVIGLALATIALSLLFGYLPDQSPLTDAQVASLAADSGADAAAIRAARLSRESYLAGRIGAWAMLGVGLLLAGLGGFHRTEVPTQCLSCGRQVFALRAAFGLRCPACNAYARVNWFLVGGTALFWLAAASLAVALLVLVVA